MAPLPKGRRGVAAVLLALVALGLAWMVFRAAPASKAGDADDLSDVVIVVGTPNKTGLRRELEASGETKDLPYKIDWAVFDSTPPLTEALKAGRVDIGGGGETGVIFAIANGARISVLAGNVQDGKPPLKDVLVRKDSPIRSFADLKGKRIAIPYRTAQHYQLAQALEHAGIAWDPRLILNLDTVNGLSALVNRQVDAFVVWDPNVAIAEVQFGARGIASLRANGAPTSGMLYAAASSVADSRKNRALRDLVRRIIRAQAWVQAHPAEWAQQMATQAQIPLAAARLTASRTHAAYVPTSEAVDRWQREIDYFHKQGQIKQPFDIRAHVAHGFDAIVADEVAKVAQGKRPS